MSAQPTFEQAWQSYQSAVRQMYSAPAGAAGVSERGEGGPPAPLQAAAAGPEVLDSSAMVRSALETSLASDSPGEREMASLKLLAAAAHDLALASDLLQLDEAGPAAQAERSAQSAVAGVQDLREVLDAPLQPPPGVLMALDRGALPTDPAAAKAALKAAITDLLRIAPQNAAEIGQSAAVELSSVGLGPVRSAASLAVDALLDHLPADSRQTSRKAGELVVEAIQKIRTAIGQENEKLIREQASEWVEDFKKDRGFVSTLLDALYETEKLGSEAMAALDQAPAGLPAAGFNAANEKIVLLSDTSEKTRKTLAAVIKVMTFVKVPLLGAVPWGPLAVCAAYLGLLGYGVYLNGDILDWNRTGKIKWLNQVQGLRAAIETAVKP